MSPRSGATPTRCQPPDVTPMPDLDLRASTGDRTRDLPLTEGTRYRLRHQGRAALESAAWWTYGDSNPEPPACKAGALPVAP